MGKVIPVSKPLGDYATCQIPRPPSWLTAEPGFEFKFVWLKSTVKFYLSLPLWKPSLTYKVENTPSQSRKLLIPVLCSLKFSGWGQDAKTQGLKYSFRDGFLCGLLTCSAVGLCYHNLVSLQIIRGKAGTSFAVSIKPNILSWLLV